MAYKRVEDVRAWQRRRYRRQTAERLARGLCPKCGKRAPAPDRSKCRQCLEQRRAADRASYARAKAEGRLYGGSDAEARRTNARARSKRRYHERSDAGLCVRCGESEPVEGSPSCERCHEARNARERARWNARRATGLCGACGGPAPDGVARCDPCAAFQQGRPAARGVRAQAVRQTQGARPLHRLRRLLGRRVTLSRVRSHIVPALRRASRAARCALTLPRDRDRDGRGPRRLGDGGGGSRLSRLRQARSRRGRDRDGYPPHGQPDVVVRTGVVATSRAIRPASEQAADERWSRASGK